MLAMILLPAIAGIVVGILLVTKVKTAGVRWGLGIGLALGVFVLNLAINEFVGQTASPHDRPPPLWMFISFVPMMLIASFIAAQKESTETDPVIPKGLGHASEVPLRRNKPASSDNPATKRRDGGLAVHSSGKEPMTMSPADDLEFYTAVAKELKDGRKNDGLWLKARVEADGDEAKTELVYVRLRVEMLKEEARALAAGQSEEARQDTRRDQAPIQNTSEAFHFVTRGECDAVREVLEAGFPLDDRNEWGATLIYLAALNGHIELVKLLLSYGADATLPHNISRLTPREAAAKFPDIAELLP